MLGNAKGVKVQLGNMTCQGRVFCKVRHRTTLGSPRGSLETGKRMAGTEARPTIKRCYFAGAAVPLCLQLFPK